MIPFEVVWFVSALGCTAICCYVIPRYGAGKSIPFDAYLCVGVAGFAVFPIINTGICLVVGAVLISWWRAGKPDRS